MPLRWFAQLGQLDDGRDTWTSFDDLQPLMDQADAAFKVLGIHYVQDENGLRVFLPQSVEANPLTQLMSMLGAFGSGKPA